MTFETGPLVAALVFSAIFLFGSQVIIPAPVRLRKAPVLYD